MRMRRWRLQSWAAVLFAAVVAVGLAGVALAQTDVTTTRITGTVKDADGGALPGATVEAKSQETSFTLVAVTDSRGFLFFAINSCAVRNGIDCSIDVKGILI